MPANTVQGSQSLADPDVFSCGCASFLVLDCNNNTAVVVLVKTKTVVARIALFMQNSTGTSNSKNNKWQQQSKNSKIIGNC